MGVGQFIPSEFRKYVEPNIHTGIKFAANTPKQIDGYLLANAKNEISMSVCYVVRDIDAITIHRLINECLIRSFGLPGIVESGNLNRNQIDSYLAPWKHYQKELPDDNGLLPLDKEILQNLYSQHFQPGMSVAEVQKSLRISK